MLTWVLVAVTAVVSVGVLALLVVREPLGRPLPAPEVTGPDQVGRSFRRVWPGYDPLEVDAHLAAVERAWRSGADGRDLGADRSGEELEERGGDGAGGLDR